MSKKHLTFDDRLAIQAGLQQGLKIAQIAKRIGKDRSLVGRLRHTDGWWHPQKETTVSTMRSMQRFPNAALGVSRESASVRVPVAAALRTARITWKSFAPGMKSLRLSAIPVRKGCAAVSGGCFMMQNTPRSSTKIFCWNHERESPSRRRSWIRSMGLCCRC